MLRYISLNESKENRTEQYCRTKQLSIRKYLSFCVPLSSGIFIQNKKVFVFFLNKEITSCLPESSCQGNANVSGLISCSDKQRKATEYER